MRVRATTAGLHLFGEQLFVQGRLEVCWEPDGRGHWSKIAVDNYDAIDWQLTLLVWGLASKSGAFEIEYNDVDSILSPSAKEEPSGSNA